MCVGLVALLPYTSSYHLFICIEMRLGDVLAGNSPCSWVTNVSAVETRRPVPQDAGELSMAAAQLVRHYLENRLLHATE